MAAPSYAESGDSAPTYSASLTDGERIPELQPSVSSPPTNLPDQYIFQSQRIKLDLGPRIWPVSTPCFAHRGMVDGVVSVTTLEHVKSITIKVEATAKAFFMQRVPSGHVGSDLFQRSVTLCTNNIVSSTLETTLTYPFSINPLQLATRRFAIASALTCHDLVYVDGRVLSFLSYISLALTLHQTPRVHHLTLIKLDLHARLKVWKKYVSLPNQAERELNGTHLQVATFKPSSQSLALAALYTDISLQLVKRTTISSPHQTSVKEKTLAFGEVYNIEEMGNGVQVLRGELGNGAPGTELSWSAAGVVEVKHVIRLSLKPPPCRIALSTKLSAFERTILIEVMTHRYTPVSMWVEDC